MTPTPNALTRPSKEEVAGMIESITFTRLPSGKAIACEITLINGWVTHGIASVVDLNNYDEQRGKDAAHSKAMQGVWDAVAYSKQVAMHFGTIENNHKALTDAYHQINGHCARII